VLEKPETFSIAQNYPNPFNSCTKINYQIKENCRVQIKIYDITGRHVRTLVDEMKNIGRHSVIWDSRDDIGNELTSGVYLYQFKAEHYSEINRMVLVK
jgi:flagellar hook assembly protein FlgD